MVRSGLPGGGLCGGEKAFEERAKFARPPEVLRVPLDAEAEAGGGILDGFNHAVWRRGGHLKSRRHRFDCLVMTAVDLAGIRIAQPLSHQLGQQRVLVEPHLVSERIRLVRRHLEAVLERARHLRGDILHERASAGDVGELSETLLL